MKLIFTFILGMFITTSTLAKDITIQAEGMMCQACVETLTDGFKEFDQVNGVTVDLENQIITLDLTNDTDLAQETIKKTITARGYKFISILN
jgi:Cu+-exporting ATPase